MKLSIAFLLGCTIALAGCAGGMRRTNYPAYAGEPVPQFRYTHLYNIQRASDRSLVVWTKPSTAYLLTLAHNCDALSGRVTVEIGGVDGIQGRLQAGTGEVIIGQMRCRVSQIQPLDLAAMKAARQVAR